MVQQAEQIQPTTTPGPEPLPDGIRKLHVYLIKPSKYDDEGYVIRYLRGVLPSNTRYHESNRAGGLSPR